MYARSHQLSLESSSEILPYHVFVSFRFESSDHGPKDWVHQRDITRLGKGARALFLTNALLWSDARAVCDPVRVAALHRIYARALSKSIPGGR